MSRDRISARQSGSCGTVTISTGPEQSALSVSDCFSSEFSNSIQFGATIANDNDQSVQVSVSWTINGTQVASASGSVPGGGTNQFTQSVGMDQLAASVGDGTFEVSVSVSLA